jgi:hypothetical protein
MKAPSNQVRDEQRQREPGHGRPARDPQDRGRDDRRGRRGCAEVGRPLAQPGREQAPHRAQSGAARDHQFHTDSARAGARRPLRVMQRARSTRGRAVLAGPAGVAPVSLMACIADPRSSTAWYGNAPL